MSLTRKIPGYTGFQPSSIKDVTDFQEAQRPQKHIPGYKGYVPGIKAENVYAKTFGRTTNDSLEGQIVRGHDLESSERYHSTNQHVYVDQSHQHKARAETNPFLAQVSPRGHSQDRGTLGHQNTQITLTYEEAMEAAKAQSQQ